MNSKAHSLVSILGLVLFCSILSAQESPLPRSRIPWDSIMAEIQTIKSGSLSDTLQQRLMIQVLAKYHVQPSTYAQFYEQFRQKSIDEQIHFWNKVQKILLDFLRPGRQEPAPRAAPAPQSSGKQKTPD